MKQSTRNLVMATFLAVFSLIPGTSFSNFVPPLSAEYTFKPVEMPKGPGLVKLELAVLQKYSDNEFLKNVLNCKELEIRITELLNIQYSGDSVWTVKVDSGVWYKTILEVIIPANDTSGIRISIKCGTIQNPSACYFVTKKNSVDFYKGHPRSYNVSK